MKGKFILKKLLLSFLVLYTVLSTTVLAAPDLVFKPREGGKYIYSNNREFIYREDLADISNEHARFIMSNEDMAPDKYTLFASHVNHTELKDEKGAICDKGFDVELDVMFRAETDCEISIGALGFEVPLNITYYINREELTTEKEWGCFTAWASYLGEEISVLDSGEKYKPVPFEPVKFSMKAGETVYLSEFIPNYRAVPIWRPVHIITDFELKSGVCDINVFAVKSIGNTAGNRRHMSKNIDFAPFIPQYEMKGVANSLNQVDAYVNLTIPGYIGNGEKLPVRVYNRYSPAGKDVTTWYTNLNPTSDIWNKDNVAESCMLEFEYKDPSKKRYYGKGVSESEKTDIWYFDTNHALLWEYKKDLNIRERDFVPNFEIDEYVPEEYCNSLGNYGVFQNYHITVTNEGYSDKWFNYYLNTGANNLIILRDENGNLVDGYPITKGTVGWKETDRLANVKVPARETVKFVLTVILTTNHPGGMENSFVISDNAAPVKTYIQDFPENVKDTKYTGREYLRYDDGKLLTSIDGEIWTEHYISPEVEKIFDTGSEIRVTYTGDGYIINNCQHSGIPYYIVRDYYREVWFLNEEFELVWKRNFEIYPTASSGAFRMDYIKAGSVYYTDDGNDWKLLGGGLNLPCYNYGRFAASARKGEICLSEDGVNFFDVVYETSKPLYIDSLGDIYYYISDKNIYVSAEGIYWSKITSECDIEKISRTENGVVINDSFKIDLPVLNRDNYVLKFNNKYFGFSKPPIKIGESFYIPLRAFAELAGGKVVWDSNTSSARVTINGVTASFSAGDTFTDHNGLQARVCIDGGTMMIPSFATDIFLIETEEIE